MAADGVGGRHSVGSVFFRIWCFPAHPILALLFWRQLKERPDRIVRLDRRG